MAKLKIGIIGCGGIANGKHFPSLAKLPDVEMVAFCDLIEQRAIDGAAKFGTPDAKVYTDYKQLLKDKSIDIVHVLTPNRSHSFITVDALNAGKHVMCEKPMAINYEEGKKMLEASKKNGKHLTIGYDGRYRPDSLLLNRMCRDGVLGEIYYAKAHALRRRKVPTWGVFMNKYEQGGGPLIDIGTHALDLSLWMMDNYKPAYVVGQAYHKLSQTENAANAWGAWDPKEFTAEDSAFGYVVMENGASIYLESSWALNHVREGEAICTLCGTKAGADFDEGLRINGEEYSRLYTKIPNLKSGGVAFYEGGKAESGPELEARLWIKSIREDTDTIVKPEQALVVTQILEAIYKSSETHAPIMLNK